MIWGLKKKQTQDWFMHFLLSVQLWYLIKGTTYNEAIIQIKTLWKVLRGVCGGHMANQIYLPWGSIKPKWFVVSAFIQLPTLR